MLRTISALLAGSALVTVLAAGSSPRKEANTNEIRRGSYLVNSVATCGDCHSPRLPDGAPDKAHWLQGTPLFFAPLHPVPNWANKSPNIAGLESWNAEDVVQMLQTGVFPDGRRPNPPMPTYHMKARDARAVVAYLKSLGKKRDGGQ